MLGLGASAAGSMNPVTVFQFEQIIDGNGNRLDATEVAVENGIIVAVGNNLGGTGSNQTVDLSGLTALPGLIDAHTHITYGLPGEPQGDAWAELGATTREQRVAAAHQNALLTLSTGVTSVRDLNASEGVDYELRDAINSGAQIGPRIFTSGPGIHPFNDPLPDGETTASASFLYRAAEKRLKAGADWIKIFGTTGSASDLTSKAHYSPDAIKAAADAAKAAGKRITVHSYGPEAVDAAIMAGVTSLDHPVGISDEQINAMLQAGIIYVPTIDHNRYYAQHAGEYGYNSMIKKSLKAFVYQNIQTVRRAHKAGVTIAMGSDAVLSGFGQNTCELKAFVSAGLSNAEAIKTATMNGAELLGMEDQLGRIAPGYKADFVAVNGDPLSDIDTITSGVVMVVKDGQTVVDHRINLAGINKPDCGTWY